MRNHYSLTLSVLLTLLVTGCANFRKLGSDLKFIEETSIATARVSTPYKNVTTYGVIIEWDQDEQKVLSADFSEVGPVGIYGFFIKSKDNQYMMAFSDRNENGAYDSSDPSWIHSNDDGLPTPIVVDPETNKARVIGEISKEIRLPMEMVKAAKDFKGVRTAREAASGWSIPVDLGTVVSLDEPRFSSERGSQGYWEPATYPMETGIGIFFLEEYDPERIPVLFVYGAAGSPQDWRTFINQMDRKKYQAWFYHYPTGRRLDELGGALNRGVELLHTYHGFDKLHVVAHSMGGLVTRDFLLKNLDDENTYITKYVTISTPWGGQEFAETGVKRAPSVIPSWRDMVVNSEFQKKIFEESFNGDIDHLLIYGYKSKRSMFLPDENDGTVSVNSMKSEPAVNDASEVLSFDEDHVSILSNPEVIRRTYAHLENN